MMQEERFRNLGKPWTQLLLASNVPHLWIMVFLNKNKTKKNLWMMAKKHPAYQPICGDIARRAAIPPSSNNSSCGVVHCLWTCSSTTSGTGSDHTHNINFTEKRGNFSTTTRVNIRNK